MCFQKAGGGTPLKRETIRWVRARSKLPPALVRRPAGKEAQKICPGGPSPTPAAAIGPLGTGRYRIEPRSPGIRRVMLRTRRESCVISSCRVVGLEVVLGRGDRTGTSGERPIPAALIKPSRSIGDGREAQRSAHANGDSKLSVRRGGAVVFYTRDPRGRVPLYDRPPTTPRRPSLCLAGLADPGESPDSQGRPVAGRRFPATG